MKRLIVIVAVVAVVTGCAMWTKAPVDDPTTPNNEAADHAAKVEQEEAQVIAVASVAEALVPPPFAWVIPLLAQGFLGAAAMRRQ